MQFSLATFILYVFVLSLANGKSLVPVMFIFGDSVVETGNNNVETGNNNYLATIIKANFPPYGRDFVDHKPIGRFCNGKLALDFIAEKLDFTEYQPVYLSKKATGKNLLIEATLHQLLLVTMSLQKSYIIEPNKLEAIAGKSIASSIISGGIYVISYGTTDFLHNYYINPLLFTSHTPDKFI